VPGPWRASTRHRVGDCPPFRHHQDRAHLQEAIEAEVEDSPTLWA
jgi:hypothetical protein